MAILIDHPLLVGVAAAATMALGFRRRSVVSAVVGISLVIGSASAVLSTTREVTLEDQLLTVAGTLVTDPIDGFFVMRPDALIVDGEWRHWSGPGLAVRAQGLPGELMAGQRVTANGPLRATSGVWRGQTFAGRLATRQVELLPRGESPVVWAANSLRTRVSGGLVPWHGQPAAGLLAGFLIGDTRQLPDVDYEALRAAGLTHFVAVSGSNVALFLGLWWILLGPLGIGPRRRAVFGLVALVVFVVMTRWEPSVLRASVMAALMLTSRAAGISVSGWTVLGVAVSGLLVWSPEMAGSVGFQLSVAATMGVMGSIRLLGKTKATAVTSAVSVTLGAQLAVAPLLLYHFGSLPILSPLANLVAAPLVAASTSVGGLGLLAGSGSLVRIAIGLADAVLSVAHAAAGWPHVGWIGFATVLGGIGLLRFKRLRPIVVLVAVVFATTTLIGSDRPAGPAAVFLDVGQGDSVLVFGSQGEVILVDGGPEPAVLNAALRRYRVDRIDLVVLSHPHADHVAGFIDVLERIDVRVLWHPGSTNSGAQFGQLQRQLERRAVPFVVPQAGSRYLVGSVAVEVLGPLRRYDSLNDQSIVLRVAVDGTSVLLSGDVEALAQRELGPVKANVLKVPHHGSDTSDSGWLVSSGASEAVIQVGENTFGHPDPQILQVLELSGMSIRRNDIEGDVVIPLGTRGSRP